MSRGVLARLVALVVITVAGLYYIAFDAVGFKFGKSSYTLHAVLPEGGGIYSDASVTLRGVTVGKVTALHLQPGDVVVDMAIRRGVRIPTSTVASVRELTAAAEQYMDLVPAAAAGPYFRPGATIDEHHTTIPTSIGQLLDTLNTLVNSVHASDLNTLSGALAQGLQGAGEDLRSIISDSSTLLQALQSATPGTVELIDAGHTDLSTFDATGADFAAFSHSLNLLSQQVASSNTDLVKLLQNGMSASQALGQFLQQYGQPTASLVDSLAAVNSVAFQREPAFRALFQVLPIVADNLAATAGGGQLRFELTFNYRNTVCPYTASMVEPTALVATADLTRNCGINAADLLQRGADKAPPPQG